MTEKEITLTIVSGPQAGHSVKLVGITMIGRDEGCDVVIDDPSVSARHARILLSPAPRLSDLHSANHTFVNSKRISAADLNHGDVIVFGSVATRLDIRDHMAEEARQKARVRRVITYAAIVVLLVVIAGMYISMQRQRAQMRAMAPLAAAGLSNEVNFPGVFTARFPTSEEFSPSPETARISRFITPWYLLPVTPKTRGELEISRVLPPDPPLREYVMTRRWTDRPPQIGARRIVFGPTLRQTFVIGNYRSVEWQFSNPGLGIDTPISFHFMLQCWDGLPPAADVSWVGLDRKAWKNGVETTQPAVPRRFPFQVPDSLWDKRSETVQTAHVSYSAERNVYLHMHKIGEALYILSFDYPAAQKERLDAVAEKLLNGQGLPGRARSQSDDELREMAVLLEREGDAFLPDLTGWSFDDFERHDQKSDLFRAFSRYMKALEFRQICGDWLNNPDYERVLAKTLMIHNYVENDRSLFRRLFWQIEDQIASHQMRRSGLTTVNSNLDTLHLIVYEGTDMETKLTLSSGKEETVSLAPDEWFMYTHLRRIAVRELERRS